MAIGKVIGRVAIKVLPDTTEFREKTANDLRRIEKQLGSLEVDVIPEIDKSAKEKLKAELKKLSEDLKVQLNLELANGDVARTQAELAAISKDRKVMIETEIDNAALAKTAAALSAFSGLRFLRDQAREFREHLMSLDTAIPHIAVVSHAIAGLGAFVLGASGNLFSLSSSLASIGPAALALPGIFGGIALGITAWAVAMKDFNKHLPNFAIGLGRAVSAGEAWKDLQDKMSDNFWKSAEGPMQKFITTLFPQFSAGMQSISTDLGKFTAALATSFTGVFDGALVGMFNDLGESIRVMTGYTGNFANIIKVLGEVGAGYLPALAKWFGDISARFDAFLSQAQADGRLQQWITTALQAMKDLGSVISSTFSIFHSLAAAATAAGGSTLGSLADTLRDIATAAAAPGFQHGLTDTLAAAYSMMNQISTIAGPNVENFITTMARRFQAFGPIIGDTIGTAISAIAGALSSPYITAGLDAMFKGINGMVHALAPAMEPLAAKFGALGLLIGVVAQNLGVVLAAAIQSLAPVFASVATAIAPVIALLGPMLAGVIKALAPVFAAIGTQLGKAATALKPLFAAVQDLINLLMPVLVPVLKIVVDVIGGALLGVIQGVTLVIKGLVNIIQGVIGVFKGLWNILAGLFTLDFGRMWDGLKQVFGGLGQILLGALQAALGAVWAYLNGTVLGFFKSFGAKLAAPFLKGPLGTIFKPMVDAATKAWNFLKKLWEQIKGLFGGGGGGAGIGAALTKPFEQATSVLKSVFNVIKTVVSTAWRVIETVFGGAIKVISEVIKTGFGVVKTIIETYFTIWKTIITTAWNVIKTVFSTAIEVIRTVFSAGFGAIKSFLQTTMDGLFFLFQGPLTAISEFLTTTWTTIKAGVMLAWDAIRVFFETFLTNLLIRFQFAWESIRAGAAAAWDLIAGVFKTVWELIQTYIFGPLQAIATRIANAWSDIKSLTSEAWDAIIGWVKARWELFKADCEIVFAFIKNKISEAWNAIKSATSDIWGAIKDKLSGAWDAIKGLISDALGIVKNAVSSAWSTIKTATSSAWDSIKSALSAAWDGMKTAVVDGIKNVVSEVKTIPKKALDALAGIGTVLVNAGKSLIQGLIDGIDQMIDKVVGKLKALTDLIPKVKGPAEKDARLLTPAGRLIMDGLIAGFEDRFTAIRATLTDLTSEIAGFIGKSMSQQISDALTFAVNGDVGAAITADASVQGVNLDRRLGGLERQISTAAKSTPKEARDDKSSISIGNILIPLEDLKQLKDLEEFFELLRVRTRQG